jgi:hypothetical protein
VPSEVLFGVFDARKRARRPSLVYCGDDRHGKKVAATLIRDVGFDPMDVGPLRTARYTEPESAGAPAYGRLVRVLEAYAPTVPGYFLNFPSRAQRSVPLRLFVEAARELAVRHE